MLYSTPFLTVNCHRKWTAVVQCLVDHSRFPGWSVDATRVSRELLQTPTRRIDSMFCACASAIWFDRVFNCALTERSRSGDWRPGGGLAVVRRALGNCASLLGHATGGVLLRVRHDWSQNLVLEGNESIWSCKSARCVRAAEFGSSALLPSTPPYTA